MRAIAAVRTVNSDFSLVHLLILLSLLLLGGCSWLGITDEVRTLPEGAVPMDYQRRAPAYNPGGGGMAVVMDGSQQSPQMAAMAQREQQRSSGMFGWLPEWMGGDPYDPPPADVPQSMQQQQAFNPPPPPGGPETDPFSPKYPASARVNSGGYPQLGATPPTPDRAQFMDNPQNFATMQQAQSQANMGRQSLMGEPSDYYAAMPPQQPPMSAQAYGQLPSYAGPGMTAPPANAPAQAPMPQAYVPPAPVAVPPAAQMPQQMAAAESSGGMFGWLPEWMGGDSYEAPPQDTVMSSAQIAELPPAAGPAAAPMGVVPYNAPAPSGSDEIIRLRPPGEWNAASSAPVDPLYQATGAPASAAQVKYMAESRYNSRQAARGIR